MRANGVRVLAAMATAAMVLGAWAGAEVSVTLTISGDMDEILAILQLLRSMGYGGSAPEEDPLRLRVHSVHSSDEETAASSVPGEAGAVAAPEPEPEPKPVIALQNPTADPASVKAGETVVVRTEVIDQQNAIDTLAATFGKTAVTVDLHDNGEQGDATAGDGVWSGTLAVPPETRAGAHEITILAYDANGDPIMTLTADQRVTSLSAKTGLTVAK